MVSHEAVVSNPAAWKAQVSSSLFLPFSRNNPSEPRPGQHFTLDNRMCPLLYPLLGKIIPDSWQEINVHLKSHL